jgi:hypothetical protein
MLLELTESIGKRCLFMRTAYSYSVSKEISDLLGTNSQAATEVKTILTKDLTSGLPVNSQWTD